MEGRPCLRRSPCEIESAQTPVWPRCPDPAENTGTRPEPALLGQCGRVCAEGSVGTGTGADDMGTWRAAGSRPVQEIVRAAWKGRSS